VCVCVCVCACVCDGIVDDYNRLCRRLVAVSFTAGWDAPLGRSDVPWSPQVAPVAIGDAVVGMDLEVWSPDYAVRVRDNPGGAANCWFPVKVLSYRSRSKQHQIQHSDGTVEGRALTSDNAREIGGKLLWSSVSPIAGAMAANDVVDAMKIDADAPAEGRQLHLQQEPEAPTAAGAPPLPLPPARTDTDSVASSISSATAMAAPGAEQETPVVSRKRARMDTAAARGGEGVGTASSSATATARQEFPLPAPNSGLGGSVLLLHGAAAGAAHTGRLIGAPHTDVSGSAQTAMTALAVLECGVVAQGMSPA
jgi:hypothetical protein